jgi:hypothetical protein
MRLHAAALFCLFAAGPAAAQSDLATKPPPGQTLLKSLEGDKNQTVPLNNHPLSETEEQRQHYIRKNPENEPITSALPKRNND